jgi:hypothetical protein
MRRKLLLGFLLLPVLNACGPAGASSSAVPATALLSPSPSPSASPTPTSLPVDTATPTFTPTLTLTASPVPTYAILRGKVNVERASCRYGPGPMYLFLYGLRQGATQDVVGRTDTGAWVLTQARGDRTRCWVKTDLLDLNGDLLSVEMVYPDKYALPFSPYYPPPYTASATRDGAQVTIIWTAQSLRAGDRESDTSPLFVVETWVCQGGQLVFTPIGTDIEMASVTDEPGCAEQSHGRVFLAEKHGYAGPTEIPWPPATLP